MFISTGHFIQSLKISPEIVNAPFDDTLNYIENSNMEFKFLFGTSIEQTMDIIDRDLSGIFLTASWFLNMNKYSCFEIFWWLEAEDLLGLPIQRILQSETGLQVIQDELEFINKG